MEKEDKGEEARESGRATVGVSRRVYHPASFLLYHLAPMKVMPRLETVTSIHTKMTPHM